VHRCDVNLFPMIFQYFAVAIRLITNKFRKLSYAIGTVPALSFCHCFWGVNSRRSLSILCYKNSKIDEVDL
jgi:hypothetical protein